MNKKGLVYIIGGIVVVAGIWLATTYNSLVKTEEKVKLQWNEMQNNYQRRLDLIPSLVSVVQGGADYEQSTLRKVIEARSKAASVNVEQVDAQNYNNQVQAQDELAASANQLIASVENYPQIKGTKAFTTLQTQLERTELRIKVARKDFNAVIADYNQKVKTFPTKTAAGILGFAPREGFRSDAGAENAVEIKF
jgi:LemA protein